MFLHHSVAFQLAHGFQASMLSAFPTQLHFKPYMDHHIYIPLRNTIFASFFFFIYPFLRPLVDFIPLVLAFVIRESPSCVSEREGGYLSAILSVILFCVLCVSLFYFRAQELAWEAIFDFAFTANNRTYSNILGCFWLSMPVTVRYPG